MNVKQMIKDKKQTSEEEWYCPECGLTGTYSEINWSGVNSCPECSTDIKELPF